jgi:3-hydroxybutyryl-CoA dehydratase
MSESNSLVELGKSFDEISLGESASFRKTISESDIYLFAGVSGDFNPLHVDEQYASQTMFGGRIAHGALPAALLAPVLGMKLPGPGTLALESTTKFRKPVYPGDTICCTVTVIDKNKRRNMVSFKVIWTNQKGETVAKGSAKVIPPEK